MAETPHDPKEYVDDSVTEASPAGFVPSEHVTEPAPESAVPPEFPVVADDAAAVDPMEYVDDPTGPEQGAEDPDEFDPFPLPEETSYPYDLGMPPEFRHPRDRNAYVPGLDAAIDAVAGLSELRRLFPGNPQSIMLGQAGAAPVAASEMAPHGAAIGGTAVAGAAVASAAAGGTAIGGTTIGGAGSGLLTTLTPRPLDAAPPAEDTLADHGMADPMPHDPKEYLDGGDGDTFVMGSAGTDRLSPDETGDQPASSNGQQSAPFINYPDVKPEQKDQLWLVTRQYAAVAEALKDPEKRAEILGHLSDWALAARQEIYVLTNNGAFVKQALNGFFIDVASGITGGMGELVGVLNSVRKDLFTMLLASRLDIDNDQAQEMTDRLFQQLKDNPEVRKQFGGYLGSALLPGDTSEAVKKGFGDAAKFINDLAGDVGINQELMPLKLQIARALGTATAMMAMPYLRGGMIILGGSTSLMAMDQAGKLMDEAGLDADDPGAKAVYAAAVAASLAFTMLPMGRMAGGGVIRGLGGRTVSGVADLMADMPPSVQQRFLGTIVEMAKGGSVSAITGFLERTISELAVWDASDQEFREKHNHDVWQYVFRNEEKDVKVDLIVGAMMPKYSRLLVAVGARARQSAMRAKFRVGERVGIHVRGLSDGFMKHFSHTLGMTESDAHRKLELGMPPRLVYPDLQTAAARAGKPVPDTAPLAAEGLARFRALSADQALQLDDRARDTRYFQGMVNGHDERNLPGTDDRVLGVMQGKYAEAVEYRHTVEFARRFQADDQLLTDLARAERVQGRPKLSRKIDTLIEYYQTLRADGGVGVVGHDKFAAALRDQLAALRDGQIDDIDIHALARSAGDESIIQQVKDAQTRVMQRPLHSVRGSFAALRKLDPNVRQDELWAQARDGLDKQHIQNLNDPDDVWMPSHSGPPGSPAALRAQTVFHMRRYLVQEGLKRKAEFWKRHAELKKDDPELANWILDNIRGLADGRQRWGDKPLTWSEQQRQFTYLLDVMNDTSGRFPRHKLGIEMQLAVSGADTLATAKRLRSEDLGPENTLKGALNRIGRAVLGRLDYGVGLSSDVYMKAYDFIRQHHPALMPKLAPVFEFIDRMRNTGGSLRHRFVSKGVAAFHLLGSLLNDIATATQPGQLSPAFAMAGHSGGSGSGGGSTPIASSGGGLGGAGGSTGSGSGGGTGTGGSTGSGSKKGKSTPPPKDPLTTDPSKDPTNRAYFHPELPRKEQEKIVSLPKGKRPIPESYLSKKFRTEHLRQFADHGAIRVTTQEAVNRHGTPGPDGGFIMTVSDFVDIFRKSGGDFHTFEKMLELDPGDITSGTPIALYIHPKDLTGLKIPSGNEGGANDKWRPGGFTGAGIPEAIADLKRADYKPVDLEDVLK